MIDSESLNLGEFGGAISIDDVVGRDIGRI